ncbi:MAG: hypothetical protein ALAOOOJD_03521 [bacterium]|nr:hypothetical protein [bacterium]
MFRFHNAKFKSLQTMAAKSTLLIMAALTLLVFSGCPSSKKMTETPISANEPEASTVTTAPEPAVPAYQRPTEEAAPAESAVPFALQNVYFEFDRYDLTPEALQILADNARVLKAHPEARVVIEGHCDERGTVEYNLALGDKRAKAAKDYLVSLGVTPSQVSTISYGKERPIDMNHSEEAWSRNRRAEFARR